MRRIKPSETLHGTRDGQLTIDHRLAERYGLTERESTCATLLGRGLSAQEIAERLEIAMSTAEKHLLGLRRKLGVATTREAAVAVLRAKDEATARIPDSFGVVLPVGDPRDEARAPGLVQDLRTAEALEAMLDRLREDLRDDGIEALFYYFVPMAAASFRKRDVIRAHSAPSRLLHAFREDGGITQLRIAARIFDEPDVPLVVDLDDQRLISPGVAAACRRASLRRGITVGSPFGVGYVVLSTFCKASADGPEAGEEARIALIRNRLLLLQGLAFSLGVLARTAGLTTRERDALASMAVGRSTVASADAMGMSERALRQTLRCAREKLAADTTTEAVAKAITLNALVFL
ncbi:MAG: hypothetical protein GY937_22210 [bacterium]|nr:hypothetical protein [bacterium]